MNIHIVKKDSTGTYTRVVKETCAPEYGESYPQKTECLCWHCCHTFESRPIPLPLSYDDRRNIFKVAGNFCSFACMAAYSKEHGRYHNGSGRGMAIFKLYKDMTGSTSPVVPVAPPRQFLKAFGGFMDIDAFRQASNEKAYDILPAKCVPTTQTYRERNITPKSSGKELSSSLRARPSINKRLVRDSSQTSETLKLKKSGSAPGDRDASGSFTPSKRKKTTILEKTLGLC